MTDTTRIRELARAATPGPWKCRKSVYGNKYRYVQFDKGAAETAMYTTSEMLPADAQLIAALDPSTVLGLCDEIEGLRKLKDYVVGRAEYARKDKRQNHYAILHALINMIDEKALTAFLAVEAMTPEERARITKEMEAEL